MRAYRTLTATMGLTGLTLLSGCFTDLQSGPPATLSLEGTELVALEDGQPADPLQETLAASCTGSPTQATAMEEAVNAVRVVEGKVPLKPDAKLAQVAQSHACDTSRMGRLTVAGSNGSSVVDRARAVDYPTCGVIQLVAAGSSPTEVVNRWMASEPHREQILGQLSDEIGAGLTSGPDGRTWWSVVIGDDCG